MDKREHWILAFLYARGVTNKLGEPIYASLRLMKDLFLLWKTNEKLENLYTNFIKYNYGPCDFDVYAGIENLKSNGLIEEIMIRENLSEFKLTPSGSMFIKDIFDKLDPNIKKNIEEIKKETNSREKLIDLLKYIYNKYPDWAEKSLIKIS